MPNNIILLRDGSYRQKGRVTEIIRDSNGNIIKTKIFDGSYNINNGDLSNVEKHGVTVVQDYANGKPVSTDIELNKGLA